MYVGDIFIVKENYGVVVTGFLFTTLAVLAVLMRTVTRAIIVRNLGLDDYFIILAMVRPFYTFTRLPGLRVVCHDAIAMLTFVPVWLHWLPDRFHDA